MRPRALLAVSAAILASLMTLSLTTAIGTTSASAEPSHSGQAQNGVAQNGVAQNGQVRTAKVCGTASVGHAVCLSKVRTNPAGKPAVTAAPSGFGPRDLQSAYNLTGLKSGGRTVAVVDAYNDPTAEADLKTYRTKFGLPACTTANGCFRKMNQRGRTIYPRTHAGWAQEISLDLDMVSATCPDCHILLVEADSSAFTDLGAAVNTAAATPGVVAISNSYGGEDAKDATDGHYFNHPGIAMTASSGDSGFQGASFPASSSYVTAVGGTSLMRATNARGWIETAWSGAGAGCSLLNVALPAAATFDTGCSTRAMADISAVANPATGVAVYDSTPYLGSSGWMSFGGTSASAPIIGSVYALSGHTAGYANSIPYQHTSALNDVISGSDGTCPVIQMCNARAGWDGPTGLGTPNGADAF